VPRAEGRHLRVVSDGAVPVGEALEREPALHERVGVLHVPVGTNSGGQCTMGFDLSEEIVDPREQNNAR
jgi:hypothetical protein